MSVSSAFSTSCCPGVRRALPILACCLVLFGTVSAWAQGRSDTRNLSRSAPQVLAAFRTVVASTRASTVSILCGGKDVALGTVVEPDGWILTKASEVQDKPTCRLQDGRKLPARVVGIDDAWDLALLKVQAHGLRPVEWRDSKHVPVGFWLASVGLEEDPVAIGVVSVSARKSTPRPAPGGHDTAEYGYLGVMLEATEDGVRIASVMPGTPAEKAGLKKDDLVLTLAGKEVRDVEVFSNLVQQFKPGEVVALRFRRGDEEKLIQATLAKRPPRPSRTEQQNRMGGELSQRRNGFPTFLQHDTVLKPSQCGGPIVDLDGKVIGINIARAGRTESYALPSEALLPLLRDLKSGKLAPRVAVSGK